jgi:hypothetical protein
VAPNVVRILNCALLLFQFRLIGKKHIAQNLAACQNVHNRLAAAERTIAKLKEDKDLSENRSV